jgi:hypothetical protein
VLERSALTIHRAGRLPGHRVAELLSEDQQMLK